MELLLNILWLLLAVPALLIWRRRTASCGAGSYGGFSCFFVLGCVLLLLFPVVSASDDLHPICAEIEESSPTKRVVKQSPNLRSAVWGDQVARPTSAVWVTSFNNETSGRVAEYVPVLPSQPLAITAGGRAPPAS
jgi:hypothetical protein